MAFIAVLFYKTEFVNLCFSSAKEGESGQVSITDPFLFLLSSLGLVCVLRSRNCFDLLFAFNDHVKNRTSCL